MRLRSLLSAVIPLITFSQIVVADDPLVVQSTWLVGFDGCDAGQQKQIKAAWDDAINLANYIYGKIAWDGWPETQFLGPNSLNQPAQGDIKKVIENAYTFGRSYFWNPFGWHIEVRCDDWLRGTSGSCKNGNKAAYTNNPGQANKDPRINFCPRFFTKLKTCSDAVKRWGNSALIGEKLNLQNYQCKGYATLHEMFHIDELSKVGGQGHIKDLKFQYYDGDFGTNRTTDAYGPLFTKAMARYVSPDVGKFVSTNADNLAQYTLAKWVNSKIKSYPHLPLADYEPNQDPKDRKALFTFIDGQLAVNGDDSLNTALTGPLSVNEADVAILCDDDSESSDGCSTDPPIIIDKFGDYPPDLASAEAAVATVVPSFTDEDVAYTLDENPFLQCLASDINPDGQGSVTLDVVNPNVGDFCSKAAGTSLTPDANGTKYYTYPIPNSNNDVVWLGAAYNYGDPSCTTAKTIDENNCKAQLGVTINDCDTASGTKFGGVIVDDCVVWSMGVDPNGDNSYPAPSSPAPPTTSSAPAPSYAPGWCGMHVIQYQKNENDGPNAKGTEYLIDVSLFDGKQQPIPLQDCNNCGNTARTVALNGNPNTFKSSLPFDVIVTVGAVDNDPINFEYNDQKWNSDDGGPHSTSFGNYDSGSRSGDTGFTC